MSLAEKKSSLSSHSPGMNKSAPRTKIYSAPPISSNLGKWGRKISTLKGEMVFGSSTDRDRGGRIITKKEKQEYLDNFVKLGKTGSYLDNNEVKRGLRILRKMETGAKTQKEQSGLKRQKIFFEKKFDMKGRY